MRAAVTTLAAALALVATVPLLSGCGAAARPESEVAAVPVLVEGWAKAAEAGEMSGVFGTLENPGTEDLVIASVTSEQAEMAELHEITSAGVMQEIAGDVRLPARGSIEFAPGADHIMLMGLSEDLLPGDDVELTIRFSDGTESQVSVPVKDYAGANENYDSGAGDAEHDAH